MNVLLFNVGHKQCGLPLSDVREVMRPLALERNQALPACVLGTCMIRERPTPVIDLGALIGCEASTVTRFITVSAGERQVALAVDGVQGTTRVDAHQFHEAAALVCGQSDVVRTLAVLDSKLVYLLNGARLLSSDLVDGSVPGEVTKRHADAPSGEQR